MSTALAFQGEPSRYLENAGITIEGSNKVTIKNLSIVGKDSEIITSIGEGVSYSIGDYIDTGTTAVSSGSNIVWSKPVVVVNQEIEPNNIYVGTTGGTVTLTGNIIVNDGNWVKIDTDSTGFTYTVAGDGITLKPSKDFLKENIRRQIRSNILSKISSRHVSLTNKVSPEEIRARETLRDMLSEKEWRRYITNGFVMVKGKSNKWYQIFNDQRFIQVYEKGKNTHSICIHTEGGCPPTDHILNMMLMINLDENNIWISGNVTDKGDKSGIFVSGIFVSGSHLTIDNSQNTNLIDLYKQSLAA